MSKKTKVNLDGIHFLDVSVNEKSYVVIAELVEYNREPIFIYGEKFDEPCNYLRSAIKKGIAYLNGKDLKCGDMENNSKKYIKRNLLNGFVRNDIM